MTDILYTHWLIEKIICRFFLDMIKNFFFYFIRTLMFITDLTVFSQSNVSLPLFSSSGELHDYKLIGAQSSETAWWQTAEQQDISVRRSAVHRPGSDFRRSGCRSLQERAAQGHRHHYRVLQLLSGNITHVSLLVASVESKISAESSV